DPKQPLHHQLWKSDGNSAHAPQMVADFLDPPDDLTALDGNLYFFADGVDPKTGKRTFGDQLWASDGGFNTRPITDFHVLNGVGHAGELRKLNGAIVFRTDVNGGPYQFWKVDNNAAQGASPLTDVPRGVDANVRPAVV